MREFATMNRRPGVTLIEVLVAMFIMAIGMLALLTLFPLGALSMAQALRDDRAASCAQIATAHAKALNIRQDPTIAPLLAARPYYPVYVDPIYTNLGSGTIANIPAASGGISRTALSGMSPVTTLGPVTGPGRWLSLLDDITFADNGAPDPGTGVGVARAGVWTWCYMLRQLSPSSMGPPIIDLNVVVYRGRSVQLAAGETVYTNVQTILPNGLTLSYAGNPPPIRPGSWILDTSAGVPNGYFYRVTNTNDQGGGQFVVEIQGTFIGAPPMQVIAMENVIEVFPRGTN